MSINEIIHEWARTQPDRLALTFPTKKRVYTYKKLEITTATIGKQLSKKGIVPGNIVVLLFTDSEPLVLYLIALLRMNVYAMPIDLTMEEDKAKDLIAFAAPACIIFSNGKETLFSKIKNVQNYNQQKFNKGICILLNEAQSEVYKDGATVLLPTSGTTGNPKIVQISQHSMILNSNQVCRFLGIGPKDIFLSVTPLVYCHGFYNGILLPVISGAGTIVIDRFDAFVAAKIWNTIKQYGITVVNIVPIMLDMIMKIKYTESTQVNSLRFMICGTANLQVELKLNFTNKFNVPIYSQYGTTEALINTINTAPDKHESVGQPIGGCEIVIQDSNGRQADVGELGEITIKGGFVTRGYFKNAELTAQLIHGNKLKTGDLGYFDKDGFMYISGRKKEIINKGGIKIFPDDINRIFRLHPSIAEVYTIGVQDNDYGEDIFTFVVPAKNSNVNAHMLFEFARSKLSRNKIPRKIFILESIPKGPTGKFKIQDLKEIVLLKKACN